MIKNYEKESNDYNKLPSLKTQRSDFVISAIKAGLGVIPFAGSLLAEVVGTVIPNQRIDRIVKFAEELEKRLLKLDEAFVRNQFTNENFTDLVEEGIRQAARSLTDERRQYIASIITNGLSSEVIEFFESKHILKILDEINDIEVIILRSHLVETINGDVEFRERHKDIIYPKPTYLGSSQEVINKNTLHTSYNEHLTSLGLLQQKYEVDTRTDELVIDTLSRAPKVDGYQITSMGRLLLAHIDLA